MLIWIDHSSDPMIGTDRPNRRAVIDEFKTGWKRFLSLPNWKILQFDPNLESDCQQNGEWMVWSTSVCDSFPALSFFYIFSAVCGDSADDEQENHDDEKKKNGKKGNNNSNSSIGPEILNSSKNSRSAALFLSILLLILPHFTLPVFSPSSRLLHPLLSLRPDSWLTAFLLCPALNPFLKSTSCDTAKLISLSLLFSHPLLSV